ncbi:MAG: signal peptidase II [Lachnospiraceae bacterium]|nr:signal peptidase II [Lachnospiraceae bacterium]
MVYLLIIFIIIAIDQFTKKIICDSLEIEEKRETVNSNILFWHKKNTGVSYSSFSAYPKHVTFITGIFTILSFLAFLCILPIKGMKIIKIGFTFIIGGAAGNLIDRLRNNCVTDFIYLKYKYSPIFNVADIFVVIGAILVLFSSNFKKN